MPKLFIPVGIPGCGKTTFARQVLLDTYTEIWTTDMIRQEIHPGKQYVEERNQEVFDTFHSRIATALLGSRNVVADATNLQDFARATLRELAQEAKATTHVFVFTNLGAAIQRNVKRDADKVPPEAMVRMLEKYEQALRDIPNETYDSVTYIEATS